VDSLPPEVERLVIGAQISPTTLDPVWKVGIAAMRTTITPARLAEVEGGSIDALGGRPVVLSPRNAYYALLTPQTVGAMHPANRQEFSRWLRANGELSAYLRDATANATAPVLLALDLTDVFDPAGVRAKLAKSKALANHLTDLDRIAHAVASLKGVRLAVQVGPTIQAELRLDCDAPTALAPVAKALVLEALDASGSAVEDLETWTARASGPAVILSGTLTERGLRQLVSPLLSPAVVATSTGSSPAAAGDSGKPNAVREQAAQGPAGPEVPELQQPIPRLRDELQANRRTATAGRGPGATDLRHAG
jgi:hypothetical protein